MSRQRWMTASAGALVLLAATLPATAAHSEQTQGASAAASPPVKKVSVRYGDGPTRVDRTGQRVLISFRGHRGDIVSLDTGAAAGLKDSSTRLLRGNRKVTPAWPFVWKLTHSGRHTFSFQGARGDRSGRLLQLLKGRVHAVRADAPGQRMPEQRRGYVDYAAVEAVNGRRLTFTSGNYRQIVLEPNGDRELVYGGPLVLEPGHQLETIDGSYGDDTLDPGRVLIKLSPSRRRFQALRSVVLPASVEGGPVTITTDTNRREYILLFDGTADQVVYPEFSKGGVSRDAQHLDDETYGQITAFTGERPAYYLRTTRSYRLSLFPRPDEDGTLTLRLRRALEVPAMALDGPPLTFTASSPGQLVFAHAEGGADLLTATNPAFMNPSGGAVDWSATASDRQGGSCSPEPHQPVGCGEAAIFTVTPQHLSSDSGLLYRLSANAITVLSVPADATGSVDLRLTTDDAQRPSQTPRD